MSDRKYRVLFYITLSYSYAVLRPLEAELLKRGHVVSWFIKDASEANIYACPSDNVLSTVAAVKRFNAHVLFAPGNTIPSFFPGIKVQVFHGFDSGKNNKFKIRGFFDLYCTQGPMTTKGFVEQRLKGGKPTFDVVETGWSKLDALFTLQSETIKYTTQKKQVLYAPTFSPKLTSTYDLLDEIKRISQELDWCWIIKFHPKALKKEVAMYKAIEGDNLKVIETNNIIPLLQSADVLLSDTSSILSEFSLQNKVAVSYKGLRPADWVIGFNKSEDLEDSLMKAFNPSDALLESIVAHSLDVHPYNDGRSSKRVVDAVEQMIEKGVGHLQRKPLNLFRSLKMRKKLRYYGF